MPEKKTYTFADLKQIQPEYAPSLDLPAIEECEVYAPKDGGNLLVFFVGVKKSWLTKYRCPFCGDTKNVIRSGYSKQRVIHDVVRNNHQVIIVFDPPRMFCKNCGQRFVAAVDGFIEVRKYTKRLEDYIKTESFLQDHAHLQEVSGLSTPTIQEIMDQEIDRYDRMRIDDPIPAPRVLGIDEKHINHIMRGTLVDVESGNLLDMLEDNDETTMTAAIKRLKDWDTNIEVVTTDMANRYLKWLPSLLPNATIIIDKFHVIQDIQSKVSATAKELYAYRKALIDQLPDEEERVRQKRILKLVAENKRLFNYSMESIIRDETGKKARKLDTVMDAFPEFRLLRTLYYYVEDMYNQETREDAERAWDEWQDLLPPASKGQYRTWCERYNLEEGCFERFKTFTRSGFTLYKPFILNYFDPGCRHTNAATEGLNNLIGRIDRIGNGYGFKHLRAKALYASNINERVYYSLDIKTVITGGSSHIGFATPIRTHTVYTFSQRVSRGILPPTNVFEENKYLLNFFGKCPHEDIKPLADVDEDSLIEYANEFREYEF